MKGRTVLIFIILAVGAVFFSKETAAEQTKDDMTEAMKKSLVCLEISRYGYEPHQPWKHRDVSERSAYGVAVGEYQVLTTAWNVRDAAFIKARRHGQNEFIGARIRAVDYESNLSLIELDPNTTEVAFKPLIFSEDYDKGAEVDFYRLSSGGHVYSGRGYLDRVRVSKSPVSYARFLNYVVANTSQRTGLGQVYCVGSKPIGIAFWSDENKEASLIPGEIINEFLADTADGNYDGFGAVGFATSQLLDPAMRAYLKMPASVKTGVYLTDVYTIGTGSDVLKKSDVVLGIDGKALNAYGRFTHPKYDRLLFHHLITGKSIGQTVLFDLWRDGKNIQLEAKIENFKASEMLVPYYDFDRQPEYVITGGFILQKLTRSYLTEWGDDWSGRVSPHLYHYYRDMSFKPVDERSNIVILSYVLPANINLGYKSLGQLVVSKFNGMTIRSISDVIAAQKLNPESKYDVIEFEMDNPKVVIDRNQLPAANRLIGRNYGIEKAVNVREAKVEP